MVAMVSATFRVPASSPVPALNAESPKPVQSIPRLMTSMFSMAKHVLSLRRSENAILRIQFGRLR